MVHRRENHQVATDFRQSSNKPFGKISRHRTHFWEDIKTSYTKMINYAKTHGFTEKQNTGLIKLIYKKGDNEDLVNYRPITLINSYIKILTKVIVNRLKNVLPKIIH